MLTKEKKHFPHSNRIAIVHIPTFNVFITTLEVLASPYDYRDYFERVRALYDRDLDNS
jgi:hypothetical protein